MNPFHSDHSVRSVRSVHIGPSCHCSLLATSTSTSPCGQHRIEFGTKAHQLSAQTTHFLARRRKNSLQKVCPTAVSIAQVSPRRANDLKACIPYLFYSKVNEAEGKQDPVYRLTTILQPWSSTEFKRPLVAVYIIKVPPNSPFPFLIALHEFTELVLFQSRRTVT